MSFSALASQRVQDVNNKSRTIDRAHKEISSRILSLSHRIDSFFGTQRGDEESNGSRLRVFNDSFLRQHEKYDNKTNVRFSLRLPQLQKLLRFSYHRDATKEEEKKAPPRNDSEALKDQAIHREKELRSPLSHLKDLANKWTFNFNTGIRVDIPPNLFARARLRRTLTFLEDWEFNPTQELNWFSKGGWGALFSHDLDRRLTDATLLRIVNTLTWNNDANETTSIHGPQIIHQINERRAISYNFMAQGSNRPHYAINNYMVSINYRQLLHSNWLFTTITPAVEYPRERQWNDVYSLFIRLEAVFGAI